MEPVLKSTILGVLKQLTQDVEDDKLTCDTMEQVSLAFDMLKALKDNSPMSKAQACEYLGMSRSVFDGYVRSGDIPKGTKQVGFKELSWSKPDLEKFKVKYANKH